MSEQNTFPRYVTLDGWSAVRLVKVNEKTATYWRDAGRWNVLVKRTEDGRLVCAHNTGPMAHSNGAIAEECSHQFWAKDNEGYID